MWVLILGAFIGIFAAIITSVPTQKGHTNRSNLWDDDEDENYNHRSPHSKSKKHNGKCDGDCANCPPHYGYRYGRWYYGHSHSEGCEFGGNKNNGGRD